mgnify:CR=1 FL=1
MLSANESVRFVPSAGKDDDFREKLLKNVMTNMWGFNIILEKIIAGWCNVIEWQCVLMLLNETMVALLYFCRDSFQAVTTELSRMATFNCSSLARPWSAKYVVGMPSKEPSVTISV